MVVQLDNELWFPHPVMGEDDGLVAIGGDLSLPRLELAYMMGVFPWYDFREEGPLWYCPLQRFVIFPEEIHVSHSMRTLMNRQRYRVTWNQNFQGVIHSCSEVDNRHEMQGAWLGDDMIEAYTRLHEAGLAASVEVWDGGRLVGGLYGVTMMNCFFGESMFSKVASGSKLALIFLARKMQSDGCKLIDCQLHTPHLASMGAKFIPYEQYIKILWDGNPPQSLLAPL